METTDDSPQAPHQEFTAPQSNNSNPTEADLSITIHHHGKPHTFAFAANSTISDLSSIISTELSIPPSNQKLLISGPGYGLQKAPFKDPDLPLRALAARKVTLMGSTVSEISTLVTHVSRGHRTASSIKPARPSSSRVRDTQRLHDDATYTFHTLRPLPYLRDPARSLSLLERLRDDAGVRSAMRTHKFSVGLLTEMDPAAHTTQESRTLGLNRNKGEVIELRLWTDDYAGFRDYKTIRRTLCHELAHNVWGEHDRNFWDLCHQIEREVEAVDWTRGGRSVGGQEGYVPSEELDVDGGGWTGGEFVLGGGRLEAAAGGASGGELSAGSLSRREIIAKAAEERARRAKEAREKSAEEAKRLGS